MIIKKLIAVFRKKKKSPKELFDEKTDKMWASVCMRYGSFDKVPKDERAAIYSRMQLVADEVGYNGYDKNKFL